MANEPIARGILTWDRGERQTNRYGAICVVDQDYRQEASVETVVDIPRLRELAGKRVRITVEVLESRASGHTGDLFLKIYPTQPRVGEVVDLGVGILRLEGAADDSIAIALVPEDGRRELWMDPRKLYRVHDQTVSICAISTEDPPTPAPDIPRPGRGAVGTGDGVQTKYLPDDDLDTIVVPPETTRIGDGLFKMDFPPPRLGKRLAIDPTRKKRK